MSQASERQCGWVLMPAAINVGTSRGQFTILGANQLIERFRY